MFPYIYDYPDSLNSYIQVYLANANDVVCRCGDVIPVTGAVTDINPAYYCGFDCTNSPGRWCIHLNLIPIRDRMWVYPLTYTTTNSGKCSYMYTYLPVCNCVDEGPTLVASHFPCPLHGPCPSIQVQKWTWAGVFDQYALCLHSSLWLTFSQLWAVG